MIIEEHIIGQFTHSAELLLLQIGNRMDSAIGFNHIKRAIPIGHQQPLMIVSYDMSYSRTAQAIQRI